MSRDRGDRRSSRNGGARNNPDGDLLSMVPFSWLDPSRYTSASGTVTAFQDRALAGNSFAQGTVASQATTPTPVAAANNALGAVLDGVNDFYTASAAITTWNYFHLSTHTTYFIWVPASLANNQIAWSNHNPVGAGAFLFGSLPAAGAHQATTQDNAGGAANQSSGGTCTVGVTKCVRVTRGATTFRVHDDGTQTYSAAVVSTPTNPASQPLLIGALQSAGNFPLNGTLLGFLSYARELNASELQVVSSALLRKFGRAG
jgi:hypothetical protein